MEIRINSQAFIAHYFPQHSAVVFAEQPGEETVPAGQDSRPLSLISVALDARAGFMRILDVTRGRDMTHDLAALPFRAAVGHLLAKKAAELLEDEVDNEEEYLLRHICSDTQIESLDAVGDPDVGIDPSVATDERYAFVRDHIAAHRLSMLRRGEIDAPCAPCFSLSSDDETEELLYSFLFKRLDLQVWHDVLFDGVPPRPFVEEAYEEAYRGVPWRIGIRADGTGWPDVLKEEHRLVFYWKSLRGEFKYAGNDDPLGVFEDQKRAEKEALARHVKGILDGVGASNRPNLRSGGTT